MKRAMFALLLFALPVLAVENDGGFTIKTEVVSAPTGRGSLRYGVLVTFATNDPDTSAFVAEVSYRVVGSTETGRAIAYAMKNYSGHGGVFLWVGQVTDIDATAYEIKTYGRLATTQSK